MTTATRIIAQFRGAHRFLPNYYPHPVWHDLRLYPTNEHAFQAAQTTNYGCKIWIGSTPTPGEPKRRGRSAARSVDICIAHVAIGL